MWLIVGLGNPGKKYFFNRHNIGYLTIDAFLKSIQFSGKSSLEQKAEVFKFKLEQETILLVKPLTYMNLSGESVKALMDYYKIDLQHLLVIQDDIDLPFGNFKFQINRGAGGHNGIKSLHETLNTMDYVRFKMGVGRPENPQMDVADYVLQNFSQQEEKRLGEILSIGADAIESFIFDGYLKSENKFNGLCIE